MACQIIPRFEDLMNFEDSEEVENKSEVNESSTSDPDDPDFWKNQYEQNKKKKSKIRKKILQGLALVAVLSASFPFLKTTPITSADTGVGSAANNSRIELSASTKNINNIYQILEDFGTKSNQDEFLKILMATGNNIGSDGKAEFDLNVLKDKYLSGDRTGNLEHLKNFNKAKNLIADVSWDLDRTTGLGKVKVKVTGAFKDSKGKINYKKMEMTGDLTQNSKDYNSNLYPLLKKLANSN